MTSRIFSIAAIGCICLCLLMAHISVLGQGTNPDSSGAELTASLDNLKLHLDKVMEENPIPGAAVAVVSGDSILLMWTSGHADLASGRPVTSRTHFTIGSCTKSFTGLAFLKLVDQGRIDLDTPVREIAPEITIDNPWEATDPVRIIHLLEHTAGFDDSRMNWFYFDGPVKSLRQALQEKLQLRKVRWKPGTRFSYSSAGYTLAGHLIEKITGQSYEDFLRQEILIPIGMSTSRIGDGEAHRTLLATGYDRNIEPVPMWHDYDVPAGAMQSSIEEMAGFVQFLLNRGRVGESQVIADSLFDRLARPQSSLAARSGIEYGYSFGVGAAYRNGAIWFGHGGAVPGFLSDYRFKPNADIGYVLLQNQFGIILYSDLYDTIQAALAPLVDPVESPPTLALTTDQLESFCGYYLPRSPRLQISAFGELLAGGLTVLTENDTLYTQGFMEDKDPLIPVSENLFRRSDQPHVSRVFATAPDGRMIYASKGSYYERTAFWKTLLHRVLVFGALILMLSSIAYALVWVPVHLYKKFTHKENRSKYVRMRVVPMLAVLSLILGIMPLSDSTLIGFGSFTLSTAIFFVSTLVFAGLSTLSLYTSYRSFYKPVKTAAGVYSVLLSASCFGMTLYLGYWDVIGLRLWAY